MSTKAAAAKITAELKMLSETVRSSFAPLARLMVTVVPIASPTSITVSMCMIWLPTATAVMVPEVWN